MTPEEYNKEIERLEHLSAIALDPEDRAEFKKRAEMQRQLKQAAITREALYWLTLSQRELTAEAEALKKRLDPWWLRWTRIFK